MPHRGSLKASPDNVAGNRDAEDDLASFEELLVEYKGAAEVLCCSEQRASSERELLACSCCSPASALLEGWRESEPEPASAPLETLPLHPRAASNAVTCSEDDLRVLPEHIVDMLQLRSQPMSQSTYISACTPNSAPWLQHKRRSATLFRGDKKWAKDRSTGILLTSSPLWQISATALCKSWE